MDALQVESLCGLINAETEGQRILALRQAENGKYLRPLRSRLVDLAARLETHIDFGDELAEGATIQQKELLCEAQKLEDELQRMHQRAKRGTLISSGINIALVGRTNVGKSSLANRLGLFIFYSKINESLILINLAEKDVAIVSNVPGTTRDSIQLRLQLGLTLVNVTDTAGIRETDDILEREGIQRSLQR